MDSDRQEWVDFDGMTFLTRREPKIVYDGEEICSADRWVLQEVFGDCSYSHPGFEIREGDVVVDVGGHIGAFALYVVNKLNTGKVYVYEPIEENYKYLERYVRENDFEGKVELFNKAVSPVEREDYKVFLDEDNTAGHGMIQEGESYEEVDSVTLDEVFNNNGIDFCDFLKIDCEGDEYGILRKTPDELFEKIDRLVLECHTYGAERNRQSVSNLSEYLSQNGFEVTVVEDDSLPEASPLLFCKST